MGPTKKHWFIIVIKHYTPKLFCNLLPHPQMGTITNRSIGAIKHASSMLAFNLYMDLRQYWINSPTFKRIRRSNRSIWGWTLEQNPQLLLAEIGPYHRVGSTARQESGTRKWRFPLKYAATARRLASLQSSHGACSKARGAGNRVDNSQSKGLPSPSVVSCGIKCATFFPKSRGNTLSGGSTYPRTFPCCNQLLGTILRELKGINPKCMQQMGVYDGGSKNTLNI